MLCIPPDLYVDPQLQGVGARTALLFLCMARKEAPTTSLSTHRCLGLQCRPLVNQALGPFFILLVSSGRHSPESGRLGEQSSGLTTALFQSPLSHVVLQLRQMYDLSQNRKKERKNIYELNEIIIKIAESEDKLVDLSSL